MSGAGRHESVAQALLAALDGAHNITRPTLEDAGFALADAFAVGERLRQLRLARGERPLGYKIGFTNRGIWDRYGVHAPIWGPVWDSTTTLLQGSSHTTSLAGLNQPRLEPEVVFGFARAPRAGMGLAELAACLDWVAHGFEIVHTHFEGWRFAAPDCMADFALHGRLFVGPRVPVQRFADLAAETAALSVTLHEGGHALETGQATIVLDGPLNALRLWVDAMAEHTPQWPIGPGDLVSTGTITDAWPMQPGQRWHTTLSDARLSGLALATVG
ncbi:MAG TPA: hydratase [Burkholderiaceae bacterium]|nr:hydratase [Burkholderiaceae bacterium]